MAGRHSSKRNRQSRRAEARHRRRVVGLGWGAPALLAFGLGPLGVAPAAHADEFDVIFDPIINAVSSVDPTLGADLSMVVGDFTTWWNSLVTDFSSLEPALGATSSTASVVSDTSSSAVQATDSLAGLSSSPLALQEVVGNDELTITDNPSAGAGGTTYVDDIDLTTGAKLGATIALPGAPVGTPQVVGNDVLITTDNPSTGAGGTTYVADINTTTGAKLGSTVLLGAGSFSVHRRWSAPTP